MCVCACASTHACAVEEFFIFLETVGKKKIKERCINFLCFFGFRDRCGMQ